MPFANDTNGCSNMTSMQLQSEAGPLAGIKVIEFGAKGPGPFAAMMLSDMGAEVVRIDRPGSPDFMGPADKNVLHRGRRSIAVDLKKAGATEFVLGLLEDADVLIEGFRPGVMERLGFAPEICLERNPKLVYGRMTGWGQEGALARAPGHDINYIALTGVLDAIGEAGKPVPPLNLVGDFGGGGMLLAFGVVSAVLHAVRTGQGQVVDAAMIDGASLLMASVYSAHASGRWRPSRESNRIDGGAYYYTTYQCQDGKWVAVGAIEEAFYADLLALVGIDPANEQGDWWDVMDRALWPARRQRLASIFLSRPRAHWLERAEGYNACISPVLSIAEVSENEHNKSRRTLCEDYGVLQPAPGPRFSKTPGSIKGRPPVPGEHTRAVLQGMGYAPADIDSLIDAGVVAEPERVAAEGRVES